MPGEYNSDDMADFVTAELEVLEKDGTESIDKGDEDQADALEKGDEETETIAKRGEAERAKETQQLNSVVDALSELNSSSTGQQLDEEQSAALLKSLREREAAEAAQREQEQRKLAAVTVSADDIQFLVKEFDMESDKAEILLRKHDGKVVPTIDTMLESFPNPSRIGLPSGCIL